MGFAAAVVGGVVAADARTLSERHYRAPKIAAFNLFFSGRSPSNGMFYAVPKEAGFPPDSCRR